MQACKPGSVTLTISKGPYHLSGPNITIGINRPTHPAHSPLSTIPPGRRIGAGIGWTGNFGRATLLSDVSAGKSRTYLVFQPVRFSLPSMSPLTRWALTPPFHPYHNAKRYGGIFSVALSVPNQPVGTFLLGSTVPYVARTFLPGTKCQGGKTACNRCKFINIGDNEKPEGFKKNNL